ncbi:LysM peptidoglycan-binding domain-containing protein [Streptomyces sp. CB00455]|uniref:LysM peptidoglycan-binding domain-containing protein n=1 Tax=Streptomyces sp. CB00455 TaxID=1703927 RepID=UPI00093E231D|nr:LysM domain-containing protein [Streptomyces sp. CB00455]
MGLFDFLKSDKKKEHEAGEKAKEQVEQQPSGAAPPATSQAADAASVTRAAAERMAAPAPPKPATAPGPAPTAPKPAATAPHRVTHTPTPASAAHKAVPAAPKPAPTAKKRTYTVRSGDSLSAIARRELGNEARWRELYAMNKGIVGDNPDLILPGMILTLPS